MATFDVDTSQMWQAAETTDAASQLTNQLASVLRSLADSAGATGEISSASALQSFILGWSAELAAEADAQLAMASDLRAAAALYDSTETLATASFTPGGD